MYRHTDKKTLEQTQQASYTEPGEPYDDVSDVIRRRQ